jgi:hypothetical protein
MADRTPPWPDRTAHQPAVDPWANPGSSWPDTGPSWPDTGPSWPDSGPAWPGGTAPGGAAPGGTAPGAAAPDQGSKAYHRGVAQVGQPGAQPRYKRPDDTSVGPPPWSAQPDPLSGVPRAPLRYQIRQLRKGGEWTTIGGLFAFICWGIWAISVRGGDMVVPVLTFVMVALVAAGVFALTRLLGRIILERWLHRSRNSAWGAHLVTGLFLFGAGVAYLRQTEWVIDAWNFVKNLS